MHKALYRTYRPDTFEKIIGQDHIVKTLQNQIKENSISHAYLFCGTRGTGKTSTAKVFSRALNCTSEEGTIPCNRCESCLSILDNTTLDVIEIDAASNNSVDDVREIRENIKYTPSKLKYKVYIIDEVHMLSQGAFNALLKTLEEPPEYVVFILATTEPNKIPATILSRCQRYDFKSVSLSDITKRLEEVLREEGYEYDEESVKLIARNAQGALRDSLSILDQCMSYALDKKITYDDVIEVLGTASPDAVFDICKAILDFDANKSLNIINDFISWGKDIKTLIDEMIYVYRNMMISKVSENPHEFIHLPRALIEKIEEDAKTREVESIIRNINILSELGVSIKKSSNPRISMEIGIIKMVQPSFDKSNDNYEDRISYIEKVIEDGSINLNPTPMDFSGVSNANDVVDLNEVKMNKSPQDLIKPEVEEKLNEEGHIENSKRSEELEELLPKIKLWLRTNSKISGKLRKDQYVKYAYVFESPTEVYVKDKVAYLPIDDDLETGLSYGGEDLEDFLVWANTNIRKEFEIDYVLIPIAKNKLGKDESDKLDVILSKIEGFLDDFSTD